MGGAHDIQPPIERCRKGRVGGEGVVVLEEVGVGNYLLIFK